MDDIKDIKNAILAMWGGVCHIENMLAMRSGRSTDAEIAHMNAKFFNDTVDKLSKEVKKDEQ